MSRSWPAVGATRHRPTRDRRALERRVHVLPAGVAAGAQEGLAQEPDALGGAATAQGPVRPDPAARSAGGPRATSLRDHLIARSASPRDRAASADHVLLDHRPPGGDPLVAEDR